MAEVFVELKAIISDFQEKMAVAREEMTETSESGSSKLSSLGSASGKVLAAVGAGLIGVGIVAVKFGNELEDAHASLAAAIAATGHNIDQYTGQINTTDKAMEKYGYTNADTQSALAQMTIALGNPTKAMGLLGLAANIAAARHISLAAAALLVTKASEGQTMALKRAGIDLPIVASNALKVSQAETTLKSAQAAVNAILLQFPDAANAASNAHAKYEAAVLKAQTDQQKLSALQLSGGQILAALSDKYKGQAAAAADTFSGKTKILKAQLEDTAAKIGLVLIPILEKLMTKVAEVIGWFQRHQDAAKALAAVIVGVLGAAMVLFTVNKISQFVRGIQGAYNWLGNLSGRSGTVAKNVEGDMGSMGSAGGGFGAALSKGLGVATAGILAFQGTTMLLKSNFLGIGGAVNSAASAVANFLGVGPQAAAKAAAQALATPADVTFLESVAEGNYKDARISASDARSQLHTLGVPGFATGGYVTQTGLALVHQGETVTPASGTSGTGGDVVIYLFPGSAEFARTAGPALRQWLNTGPGRNAVRNVVV